ncbi:MAG: hypothetical protein Q8Q57_09410 [Methylotenera sp.]|nr:hypothetical protein [Methylotenera sp.]
MAWATVTILTTDMDAAGDNPGNARAQIKQMADNINIIKDAKGVADGIAELDSGGKVPASQLPTIPANQGGTGQTTFTVGDIFYANSTSTLAKLAAGTAGTVLTSNGAGAAPSYQVAGGVPSGTRMSFNQTSAPTGWTKDTTAALNDSILRIVTGTVGSGGSTAFSTFNGQTKTAAYTLAIADIPAHSHTYNGILATSASGGGNMFSSNSFNHIDVLNASTGSAGSGGAHSHGMTTSIKYNDFIIAQKA